MKRFFRKLMMFVRQLANGCIMWPTLAEDLKPCPYCQHDWLPGDPYRRIKWFPKGGGVEKRALCSQCSQHALDLLHDYHYKPKPENPMGLAA